MLFFISSAPAVAMSSNGFVYHCNCTVPIGGADAVEEMVESGAKIPDRKGASEIGEELLKTVLRGLYFGEEKKEGEASVARMANKAG